MENRFGEYISNLRREKQISLEQLSEGLCDLTTLSRFLHGEREPERLMQNRFLTRLGAVPENYENFLYYYDYCRWEKQQGILHHILEENIKEAKRLLEEYYRDYDMNYSLELQFYLAMLAQIRRYEGCEQEELAELFSRALELTVPNLEQRGIMDRVLSLEEINLLLEKVYCNGDALECYEEILAYIEKMERTVLAMAKIYPKAVYYYFCTWKSSSQICSEMTLRMLELCDKAIEILRDANRMFFLWELFCMREQIIPLLPKEKQTEEAEQSRQEDCRGWKETLEELYEEYGVTIRMYEFCYLYVESENYCIGDVIRTRRKMLGLSQKKLCADLCDERTISRLENNKSKPQREVVKCLFDRLNLSTELCRTELVTESKEAIEKHKELKRQINNRNYKKVEQIVEELKEMIDMEIPSNKQAVARKELYNKYIQGEILQEEYISKLKMILEYTVPYKAATGVNEKYLSNEEIICLQNMTLEIGWEHIEKNECIEALINYCENPKYSFNYVRMYEYLMIVLSNNLGNKGDFEHANRLNKNIIQLSLKCKRIKALDNSIYGILWNKKHEYGGEYDEEKIKKILMQCLKISNLSKKKHFEKIYKSKLSDLEVEIRE